MPFPDSLKELGAFAPSKGKYDVKNRVPKFHSLSTCKFLQFGDLSISDEPHHPLD
jgi:hypothetical protein